MWELGYKESWALKKWCFWTVVLVKILRVPWIPRTSNHSILKEISPGCSLEGLMWSWNSNILATWCEELTHLKRLWQKNKQTPTPTKKKRPWCWERLKARGEVDKRGWDGLMASLIQWTWGLECKSRKSRNTWGNRQIWLWSTDWSRAKANRVQSREFTGHSKHPLPTTQGKTLHMDITRWSIPKSDWLYSLQPKMERLYTVSKNKTGSWLWLISWTTYCQIPTEIEESGENHYIIQVWPECQNPLWLYSWTEKYI